MNALQDEIAALIDADGPMPVATFMGLALGHRTHGYYRKQDPLGAAGDFITAPEISQMFGELVGLCLADFWQRSGSARSVHLVELGPGRGTLMADILRATRVLPTFRQALGIHLVETSPFLRARQREALGDTGASISWHDTLGSVPRGEPLFLIANEFFDALPVAQYQYFRGNWHLRTITHDSKGGLGFALSGAVPIDAASLPRATPTDGDILEACPAATAIMADIADRLAQDGGIALVIDYGHEGPAFGDTLQAMHKHKFVPVLETPGDADLTTHVDFGALSREAHARGCRTNGPAPQGEFLDALGLGLRAESLARANPARADDLRAAASRLAGADAMGHLFKVMAVLPPDAPLPAGFAP